MLLRLQVLSKTMDSTTLSPEKVELATVTRNESTGEVSKVSVDQQHMPSTGQLLPVPDTLCLLHASYCLSTPALLIAWRVGPPHTCSSQCKSCTSPCTVGCIQAVADDHIYPHEQKDEECSPAVLSSTALLQVVYKVYNDAELQPLLAAVNEETQKEKDSEA